MGRLFWKFFVSILLAQLAATVAIGGAVWLKNRNQAGDPLVDLDTSPPAEMAILSAAATLEFGGAKALKGMLESMDRRRVFAVDDSGHEILGRIVSPAMLIEANYLLKQDNKRRVVRQLKDADGKRYLLFLPSAEHQRGIDAFEQRPLMGSLAGLGGASAGALLHARGDWARRDRYGERAGPGNDGPPWPGSGAGGPGPDSAGGERGPGPGNGTADRGPGAQDGADRGAPGNAGDRGNGGAGDGRGRNGGPGGPGGPGFRQFQPLTPFVPIGAAILASLLVAVLLAWYFSRPIRDLRLAFEAAAGGDLAPRFANAGGKRSTELNDLGRDFDRMTARLRSLIDGQTRLLHDVSHELRSPLARLQAAIGLAHQQPDKLAGSLERIERESIRMDKLVGELLTLARLEAGALATMREDIGMAELLDQIADDARFEASSQQRSVVQEGDADVIVAGQADLLARAIENVLRNAIKHSPADGTVQLQTQVQADGKQLCIRILDRGPGVAPAELDTIFQPFFRSSNTNTEGHGLGLAIAQHVINAHGGSIEATNRPDGGLCVEIVLPVAAPGVQMQGAAA